MTSPAKSTTKTFNDHSNDPQFKNRFMESSGVTVKPVPGYSKQRQGEFGDVDGGAFPDSNYITYNKPPSQQKSAACGKGRKKRTTEEMSLDPLDPAKLFKHKRVPKASGSLPVSAVYLQPRPDVTVKKKQQQDWMIPPCISNWGNQKGESIPIMNDNFGKVSQVLYVAEQRARQAASMRLEVEKEMEKERKEQELRDGDADTGPTRQTETS